MGTTPTYQERRRTAAETVSAAVNGIASADPMLSLDEIRVRAASRLGHSLTRTTVSRHLTGNREWAAARPDRERIYGGRRAVGRRKADEDRVVADPSESQIEGIEARRSAILAKKRDRGEGWQVPVCKSPRFGKERAS